MISMNHTEFVSFEGPMEKYAQVYSKIVDSGFMIIRHSTKPIGPGEFDQSKFVIVATKTTYIDDVDNMG